VSIETRHIPLVTNPAFPYWVAEKTDGVRVALICTKLQRDGVECCFLMDRLGRLFAFPLRADKLIFNDSVFDAELVVPRTPAHEAGGDVQCATPSYVVLVFDVACLEGDADVARRDLSQRLLAIHTTFPGAYKDVATPEAQDKQAAIGMVTSLHPDTIILAKNMRMITSTSWLKPTGIGSTDAPSDAACAAHVESEEDALARLSAPTMYSSPSQSGLDLPHDGYVLTPDKQPACAPGTADTVLKIKTTHTMDLLWDGKGLWYGDGDELFSMDVLGERRAFQLHGFPAYTPTDSIVEVAPTVSPDGNTITLTYMGVRLDRSAPNNAVCVLGSIASMDDAVTLDLLLAKIHGRHMRRV
jgi:hypothetical protein